MFDNEKVNLPIISTNLTSGLTTIQQLTDTTANEVFAIRDTTSGTEVINILWPVKEKEEKKEEE